MGNNLDLTALMGAPISMKCPKCKNKVNTYFEEYDIDCGNPNPEPGKWVLRVQCTICDHEFTWEKDVGLPGTYEPKCKECGEHKELGEKTGLCLSCLDWKMDDLNR